jgi:phosphomethylpyrimidine synthase
MKTDQNGVHNNGEEVGAIDPNRPQSLPNSKKIYVAGELHPDIRVPFREISLAPTKSMAGEIEINEPVRVYDTSGPWGDPSVTLDPVQGLPLLETELDFETRRCQRDRGPNSVANRRRLFI